LPVAVLDSHTHLDIVGGDPVAQIAAAKLVGVDRLVQVGVDVHSSRWGAVLAESNHAVLATVALHPNEAPRLIDLDGSLREIENLAAQPRVRGVGETGLDHFRTGADGRQAQEASFRAHIAIAKRFDKALVIHDRDAHADVLRILDEEGAPRQVVMHCFSGDAEFARECVKRDFVLSFAGTVTFGNAHALREAAAVTPLDHLLVETDAPYLTPQVVRKDRNQPANVVHTARFIADLRGIRYEELETSVEATAARLFGW
jgi:TatD DNase family protein